MTGPVQPGAGALSVLLFDTKLRNPNHHIVNAVLAALRASPRVARVVKATHRDAAALARREGFDVLLALDGENLVTDVVRQIASFVKLSVLWTWDDPFEREQTLLHQGLFDLVFTNDRDSAPHYAPAATFLQLAADRVHDHKPVRDADGEYQYDVAFVGTAWPNRTAFLNELLSIRPGLRYKFALGYNEHIPFAPLAMPAADYMVSAGHAAFVETANRSRIVLTLHRDFGVSTAGLTRSFNPGPRLFEVAAAGGFQLVDRQDTDLRDTLDPDREIGVFTGVEQCAALIDRYLADPALRIAKAQRAQRTVLDRHLYDHRVETMLAAAAERLHARPPPPPRPAADRPRVLFVTHNTLTGTAWGGVEVYQETLSRQFRRRYEVLFYHPVPGLDGQRCYALTDARHQVLDQHTVPDYPVWETLTHPAVEMAFAGVLAEHEIDLVHFHHLIYHPLSLPVIARMMGVRTAYTGQDFWLVCHRYNLLNHQNRYCRIAERSEANCDVCLQAAEKRPPRSAAARRAFVTQVVKSLDCVVANSPSSRCILQAMYPALRDEVILDLGLPLPAQAVQARTPGGPGGRLSVVFLGNFHTVKGASTFLQVAAALAEEPIDFTVCGRVDEPFPQALRDANLPNLRVEGQFQPGELDLTRFDIGLFLSIWPETYCITLSEALVAGVVPVVTAVGALGDRIRHGHNGFTVGIEEPGEIIDLLRVLDRDRALLRRVRQGIARQDWITPAEHAEVLGARYDALLRTPVRRDLPAMPPAQRRGAVTLELAGIQLHAATWGQPATVRVPPMKPDAEAQGWRELERAPQVQERLLGQLRDGAYVYDAQLAASCVPLMGAPSGGEIALDASGEASCPRHFRLAGRVRAVDGKFRRDRAFVVLRATDGTTLRALPVTPRELGDAQFELRTAALDATTLPAGAAFIDIALETPGGFRIADTGQAIGTGPDGARLFQVPDRAHGVRQPASPFPGLPAPIYTPCPVPAGCA